MFQKYSLQNRKKCLPSAGVSKNLKEYFKQLWENLKSLERVLKNIAESWTNLEKFYGISNISS